MEDSPVGKRINWGIEWWTCIKATHLRALKKIDDRARALYEQIPTPKPKWEQLGDVTKSVHRNRAKAGEVPDEDVWECTLLADFNDRLTYTGVFRYPREFKPKKPTFKVKPKETAAPTRFKLKTKPKLSFKLKR